MMGSSVTETNHQTGTWTLLLAALLISALRSAVQVIGDRLLYFNLRGVPEGSGFFFNSFLLFNLLPFLINPALFFYIFYVLGKNVQLAERYMSVIVSLFVGGLVGTAPVYFLLPIAFGGTWGATFPDLLSVITTMGSYLLAFIEEGLGAFFPGFVAIALANLRAKGRGSRSTLWEGDSPDISRESKSGPDGSRALTE